MPTKPQTIARPAIHKFNVILSDVGDPRVSVSKAVAENGPAIPQLPLARRTARKAALNVSGDIRQKTLQRQDR